MAASDGASAAVTAPQRAPASSSSSVPNAVMPFASAWSTVVASSPSRRAMQLQQPPQPQSPARRPTHTVHAQLESPARGGRGAAAAVVIAALDVAGTSSASSPWSQQQAATNGAGAAASASKSKVIAGPQPSPSPTSTTTTSSPPKVLPALLSMPTSQLHALLLHAAKSSHPKHAFNTTTTATTTTTTTPSTTPTKQQSKTSSPSTVENLHNFKCNLFLFKTIRCDLGNKCRHTRNSADCTFAHSASELRRKPNTYAGHPCKSWTGIDSTNGSCPLGDSCRKAHGIWEVLYHPQNYGKSVCEMADRCELRFCPFKHLVGTSTAVPVAGNIDTTTTTTTITNISAAAAAAVVGVVANGGGAVGTESENRTSVISGYAYSAVAALAAESGGVGGSGIRVLTHSTSPGTKTADVKDDAKNTSMPSFASCLVPGAGSKSASKAIETPVFVAGTLAAPDGARVVEATIVEAKSVVRVVDKDDVAGAQPMGNINSDARRRLRRQGMNAVHGGGGGVDACAGDRNEASSSGCVDGGCPPVTVSTDGTADAPRKADGPVNDVQHVDDATRPLDVVAECDVAAADEELRCRRILKCGHRCDSQSTHPCTPVCRHPMPPLDLPCGHSIVLDCVTHATVVADPASLKCDATCGATLPLCGHKCGGMCGHPLPHVHRHPMLCERAFPCGHPCAQECTGSHLHDPCEDRCMTTTLTSPCAEPCAMRLPCGHPCISTCSLPCPPICRLCDSLTAIESLTCARVGDFPAEARFMLGRGVGCACLFEVEGYERWLRVPAGADTGFVKVCPGCGVEVPL